MEYGGFRRQVIHEAKQRRPNRSELTHDTKARDVTCHYRDSMLSGRML